MPSQASIMQNASGARTKWIKPSELKREYNQAKMLLYGIKTAVLSCNLGPHNQVQITANRVRQLLPVDTGKSNTTVQNDALY